MIIYIVIHKLLSDLSFFVMECGSHSIYFLLEML